MSDDGEKDTGKDAERSSSPQTAADRRARRSAARTANAKGGDPDTVANDDPPAKGRPATKGKAPGSAPARRKDSTAPAKTKRDRDEERLPLHKRIVRYIRQVVDELRKVIWPTRKQMVTYTLVVISFVAFMVALVALLDWAFGKVVFEVFG